MADTQDRILYEQVMRDDRRPSPFCWRIRMALAHKGLEYSTVPVKFTDKDKIAFANTKQVPVLVDFGEVEMRAAGDGRLAVHATTTYALMP